MDTTYYLDKFQKAVDKLDQASFKQQQLVLKVGVWLNSVVLKVQKPSWLNKAQTAKPFQESVFFSIWINDEGIRENKLYYNIHALKLRELTAYKIQSREFAEAFRIKFKPFEKEWPNVSTHFGPLTLMEGWIKPNPDSFETELNQLVNKFLSMQFILDDLLKERKK